MAKKAVKKTGCTGCEANAKAVKERLKNNPGFANRFSASNQRTQQQGQSLAEKLQQKWNKK